MRYSICYDIGGTRIKLGVMSEGKLLFNQILEIDDNTSLTKVLEVIKRNVKDIEENHVTGGTLVALGFSLPCVIDSAKNRILSNYVKYTDAGSIDLNEWSMQNFKVPIFLENDARAALMGEANFGVGKGYQDLVMLTFGTGIGSAVMLNGQLLKGKDFLAGNLIGHSIIDFNGPHCNCGGYGCLEAVASSWSLETKRTDQDQTPQNEDIVFDFKFLFEEYKRGNKQFSKILLESLDAWGKMVVNLVLAYNPECIICAGGIMNEGDMILESFRKSLDQHGWISSEQVTLLKAENLDFAAIYGLSAIVDQNLKT